MSVLLVDIGNTRIKWARLMGGRLGHQQAAAFADWTARDFARRVIGGARGVGQVLVSSVAGAAVNRVFLRAAKQAGTVAPDFLVTRREAGGVTTAYLEPWRLGVDRFAMAIGAHQLAKRRPACIVSVGTTLTIDLVTANGRHMGGAILPSPRLMVDSLLRNTDGIRKRASGGQLGKRGLFARTTRAAIEQGALYAAAAVIDRAAEESRWVLGRRPLLLMTGGGAKDVTPLVRTAHTIVPDLVLRGLAVLAADG